MTSKEYYINGGKIRDKAIYNAIEQFNKLPDNEKAEAVKRLHEAADEIIKYKLTKKHIN